MKRFVYWRLLIGCKELKIHNRMMTCEIVMPSREAFEALVDYWNARSTDWAFLAAPGEANV